MPVKLWLGEGLNQVAEQVQLKALSNLAPSREPQAA